MGKDSRLILDPLADNNPITIQVLGICSALAITAELEASIVMSISVLFVLGIGNVVISLMRNIIPSKIKIIVQLIVVATLVIIVDLVLKAFAYELSKTLSVFVGLIITKAAAKAGIKHLHAHLFRHYYGTYSVLNGVNLIALKSLMGHKTVQTTERYVHIADRINHSYKHQPTAGIQLPKALEGATRLHKEVVKRELKSKPNQEK